MLKRIIILLQWLMSLKCILNNEDTCLFERHTGYDYFTILMNKLRI